MCKKNFTCDPEKHSLVVAIGRLVAAPVDAVGVLAVWDPVTVTVTHLDWHQILDFVVGLVGSKDNIILIHCNT